MWSADLNISTSGGDKEKHRAVCAMARVGNNDDGLRFRIPHVAGRSQGIAGFVLFEEKSHSSQPQASKSWLPHCQSCQAAMRHR